MTFSRKITCPYCGASDRVAAEAFNLQLECRKCGRAMFAARPDELDAAGLQSLLTESEVPVLVDFFLAEFCDLQQVRIRQAEKHF